MAGLGPDEHLALVNDLCRTLSPAMPQKLSDSSIYVDLTDVYGICRWYVDTIDQLLAASPERGESLGNLLIDMQIQIIDHFAYHSKKLKKTLPIAIDYNYK